MSEFGGSGLAGTAKFALETDVNAFKKGLEEAKREAKTAGDKIAEELDIARKTQGSLEKLGMELRDMSRAGGQLKNFGRNISLATAPLALAGGLAVKMSLDFQKSFTEIEGLVGASTEDLKLYRNAVLELSGRTARAPQELAEALYFVTSAGFSGREALAVLEAAAKAAAAGLGETQVVADSLTSVLNAYTGSGMRAADATDILVAAVREGKAEASAFAPVLGNVIPFASAVGIAFNDVAAAMAIMTRTGMSAGEAATSVRSILQSIFSPTERAKNRMEELGISMEIIRQTIREKGLLAGLQLFWATMGGSVDALRQVMPSVEAQAGLLNLLAQDGEEVLRVFEGMEAAGGSLDKAFGIASQKNVFKLSQALQIFKAQLIEVGDIVVPIVTFVVTGAALLVGVFSKLPEVVQYGIVAFGGFLLVLGPLIIGLGMLFIAIGTIITVAPLIGAVFAAALPWILLIGGAIALLVGVGLLVKENWTEIKAFGISVWTALGTTIQGIVNFFVNHVVSRIAYLGSFIVNGFKIMAKLVGVILDVFSGNWAAAWDGMKDIGVLAMQMMGQLMMATVGQVVEDVVNLVIKGLNAARSRLNKWIGTANKINPFGDIPEIPEMGELDLAKTLGITKVDFSKMFAGVGSALGGLKDKIGDLDFSASGAMPKIGGLGEGIDGVGDKAGEAGKKVNILEDGLISLDEALAHGLSAAQAGAIEAADAIVRGNHAAAEAAFNLEKIMARVAYAFQQGARAAEMMVLSLAREAMAKIQAAQQALFGQPTQEVAKLQLALAKFNLGLLQLEHQLKPKIESLQEQLRRLNDKTRDSVKEIDKSIDALRDQTSARKKNLQREEQELDDRIDAIKEEGDLRVKGIRDQIAYLRTLEPTHQDQINMLEEQIRVIEAETDTRVNAIDDQKKAIRDQIQLLEDQTDAQIKALERQRLKIEENGEKQAASIQKQIDSTQKQIDKYKENGDAIQYQISLYQAHASILQAEITAANKALLTEGEQRDKAMELVGAMGFASEQTRTLAERLNEELIPEFNDMRTAFDNLFNATVVLNDEALRNRLIPTILGPDGTVAAFDAAAWRLWHLNDVLNDTPDKIGALEGAIDRATNSTTAAARKIENVVPQILIDFEKKVDGIFIPPPVPIDFRAFGGPVSPGMPYVVGELGPELFVPDMAGNIIDYESVRDRIRAGSGAGEVAAPSGSGNTEINFFVEELNATDRRSAEKSANDLGYGLVAAGFRRGIF